MTQDSLQISAETPEQDVHIENEAPARTVREKPRAESADTAVYADSLAADSLYADSIAATIAAPVAKPAPPPPPPAWTTGLEPVSLPARADRDSTIMTSLVVVLLLIILCIQKSRRLLPMLFKDLWRVRNRKKSFDEHTANEDRSITVFGLQLTIYLAILLSAGIDLAAGRPPLIDTAMSLLPALALCAAFYLFQISAYWAVGFAFSTSTGRRMWLRGFNAIQTFLGFALAIPALTVIFYPDASRTALIVAAFCYILARIVFISKGFRIFYHNYWSLLYFILYLCTLEIAPLFILYRLATTFIL